MLRCIMMTSHFIKQYFSFTQRMAYTFQIWKFTILPLIRVLKPAKMKRRQSNLMVCNYSWWRNVLIRKKIAQMTSSWEKNEIEESKTKIHVFTCSFPYRQSGKAISQTSVKQSIRLMESHSKSAPRLLEVMPLQKEQNFERQLWIQTLSMVW